MELLTLSQGQGNFDPTSGEIKLQGNQGQAFLFNLANQLPNFSLVQQQPASASRVVVVRLNRRTVGRDVNVVQPDFSFPNQGIPISEICLAGPH